jgi:hypothetical protein
VKKAKKGYDLTMDFSLAFYIATRDPATSDYDRLGWEVQLPAAEKTY